MTSARTPSYRELRKKYQTVASVTGPLLPFRKRDVTARFSRPFLRSFTRDRRRKYKSLRTTVGGSDPEMRRKKKRKEAAYVARVIH